MVQSVGNDGFKYHQAVADEKENKVAKEANIEAAARAIIETSEYRDGEKDQIVVDGKKLTLKDIQKFIEKADVNNDGTITADELKSAGGDKYNLLKMSSDKATQKKFSETFEKEQQLGGVRKVKYGLEQKGPMWAVAKQLVSKYVTKETLSDLLKNPEVKDYVEKELITNNKNDVHIKKHLLEVLENAGITKEDLKSYNISDEKIKQLYSSK